MILPTIHSNGTAAETLLASYMSARDAIREAERKMMAIELNGRDYYPQGHEVFGKAQRQFCEQIAKLKAIDDQLYAVIEHCQEAIDAKEKFHREMEAQRQQFHHSIISEHEPNP